MKFAIPVALLGGLAVLAWLLLGGESETPGRGAGVPDAPTPKVEEQAPDPRAVDGRRVAIEDATPDDDPSESVEVTEAPVVVEETPSVTGRVVLGDGTPLPGVTVVVKGLPFRATTDERGRFVFESFPDGTRELLVRHRISLPTERNVRVGAGDEDVEVEVRATLLRVFAERGGARVPIDWASAARVLPDGSFRDDACAPVHSAAAEFLQLIVPADVSVLVHARDAEGLLAALIDTPPRGGAIATVARTSAPGLASLRIVPGSAEAGPGWVRVVLRDQATGEALRGRFDRTATSAWTGLIPGAYSVALAFEEPDGSSSSLDLAPSPSVGELVLEGDREALLGVDLVSGGLVEVVIDRGSFPEPLASADGFWASSEGGLIAAVASFLTLSTATGDELPVQWISESRGGELVFRTASPVPAGEYEVNHANALVIHWRGTATVLAGQTTVLRQ